MRRRCARSAGPRRLPAGEYDWARLPGAVNVPLKELDARTGQLDRSRPVIVYCHDSLSDMSPRAA